MPDRGESLDAALDRYGVTHLSVVVTQLRRLLGRPDPVPRASLRHVLVGGSEVPRALLVRAQARGWPVYTSYGCTEMAIPDPLPARRYRPAEDRSMVALVLAGPDNGAHEGCERGGHT